jgi:hypothetical protein
MSSTTSVTLQDVFTIVELRIALMSMFATLIAGYFSGVHFTMDSFSINSQVLFGVSIGLCGLSLLFLGMAIQKNYDMNIKKNNMGV